MKKNDPAKIAVLTPDLIHLGGGVSTVANFIYSYINKSDKYTASLISVASTSRDQSSVRLRSPRTWVKGVQVEQKTYRNHEIFHVGCRFAELEYRRYMPSKKLTELLDQYDLVQIVSGGPAMAYLAKDVKKRPVCLFIATLAKLERKSLLRESSLFRKVYSFSMLPIVSRMEIQALKHIDHVFAESEYTKQAISPFVDKLRISTNTFGIDVNQFQPLSDTKRTEDYILTVGRFSDPRKNVIVLFEAYALLKQWMPSAPRLILAGASGPTTKAWTRAQELGIADHVQIKTLVDFDELITLYQNAACFTLSSDEEGLGIVLLEAMACATPVVSTRSGGPNSIIVEEVGFLTPIGDSQALAERLLWLIQNRKQRRDMGHAGRQLVEEKFSEYAVGQKYLDVYDQLLYR